MICCGPEATRSFEIVVDDELNASIVATALGRWRVGHLLARYERHAFRLVRRRRPGVDVLASAQVGYLGEAIVDERHSMTIGDLAKCDRLEIVSVRCCLKLCSH